MPTLLEVQASIRHRLLDDDASPDTAILADGLVSTDRLGIYRNTSRSTLTKALRLNYPAVERLVGADFFAAAADAFIVNGPPRTAWLDAYGAGFPGFLQGFEPAATLPYLPDVARLEWAIGRALHAVDAEPLAVSSLVDVAASASMCTRLRFEPHPSVGLVSSDYPVDAIWRAVLAGDDVALAAVDLGAGPVRLLVERCPDDVAVTRLDRQRWIFAGALLAGHPLSAAMAAVDDPDATVWLAEHLAAGRFIGFALSDTDTASLVAEQAR